MKQYRHYLILLMILLGPGLAAAQVLPSLGASRAGTYGFQYLKIGPDARSAGMGNSSVADAMDVSALYWNPALSAQLDHSQAMLGHTQYFADIAMNYAGYVYRMRNVALGVSYQMLDSGEMDETTELQPGGTGRTFRTIHYSLGLSFAQELTSLFSYGVTLKFLDESVEEITSRTGVLDAGFFYRVGGTGLRFAVGLNNFGFDADPAGETRRLPGPNEQNVDTDEDGFIAIDDFNAVSPPTTFILGSAYDLLERDDYIVTVTGQLTNPADAQERFSLGTELDYLRRFFVRTGFEFGVDEAYLPSFGVGFNIPLYNYGVRADYGFSTREYLGSLHRISIRFDL